MKLAGRKLSGLDGILIAAIVVIACAIDSTSHAIFAQNPFGQSRALLDSQVGGVAGWLLAKQAEFYSQMSATIRAAKSDGTAVWTLLAISFGYGIFHAAGPGHGKAVISSYLVANRETARRGIALSFVSALMQSLVAVLIVAIGAWLLNVTATVMCDAERTIEIASYLFISVFGLRLFWTKALGLFRTISSGWARKPVSLSAASRDRPDHAHAHDHDHHHVHSLSHLSCSDPHHATHDHGDEHHSHGDDHIDPVHDEHCGHSHGPLPEELAGPGGWRRGLSAVFTVGIRPCSGAILVLVFALSQGLFWAGVAATFVMGLGTAITVSVIAVISVFAKDLAMRISTSREGAGGLVIRGLEVGASALLLLFGVGLLFGYVAAERVTCF